MSKIYHRGHHCKYLLKIHMIFVVKYRKRLLVKPIDNSVKEILLQVSRESDFTIEFLESDADHIHMLIDYPPTLSIQSIVNRLKSISTNRIWKQFGQLIQNNFWKEKTFWSDGYFVCSTGDASTETIRKYIEEQG